MVLHDMQVAAVPTDVGSCIQCTICTVYDGKSISNGMWCATALACHTQLYGVVEQKSGCCHLLLPYTARRHWQLA